MNCESHVYNCIYDKLSKYDLIVDNVCYIMG